jgi:hypothetical protein
VTLVIESSYDNGLGGIAKTMKKQTFRAFKDRVQLLGLRSLVFVWLGVLRAITYDIPRDFP